MLGGHLGKGAISIVAMQLIDLGRCIATTAFGDVQVHVAIIVVIDPDRTVITTIGRIAQAALVEGEAPGAIVDVVHVRQHVVANERIEMSVIVDVHEIRSLREHVFRTGALGELSAIVVGQHERDTLASAIEQIVVPIAGKIACGDAPRGSVLGRFGGHIGGSESAGRLLPQDRYIGRGHAHHIIQEITVHIHHAFHQAAGGQAFRREADHHGRGLGQHEIEGISIPEIIECDIIDVAREYIECRHGEVARSGIIVAVHTCERCTAAGIHMETGVAPFVLGKVRGYRDRIVLRGSVTVPVGQGGRITLGNADRQRLLCSGDPGHGVRSGHYHQRRGAGELCGGRDRGGDRKSGEK